MSDEREGGAWIGQRPDENTEAVEENLNEDAERVAVTDNTAELGGETPDQQNSPAGHREPTEADGFDR